MVHYKRTSNLNRVLITGGMGFIGSHLSDALIRLGYDVTVLDNLATGSFENVRHLVGRPRFHYVIEDVKNEAVLDRLASQSAVIFHLAAVVGVQLIVDSPMNTIHNNVEGTEIVLKTALRYRTKVIITSTSEVYGKLDRVPFSEDNDIVLGPSSVNRWAYAASKLIDEFIGLAYYREKNLPVVILRLFNTVGPRQSAQYGMVIPRFIQQALKGEPLTVYGDGNQTRCFTHVHDVVKAIVQLAECPQAVGQIYNIGSNEEITILELARRVLEITDIALSGGCDLHGFPQVATFLPTEMSTSAHANGRIRMLTYQEAYGGSFEDMRRRVPDISKIHLLTGWQPTLTLDEIIRDILSQYVPRPGVFSFPSQVSV